jgi:N-acylethanolamine-hydrolysing acid amidase
VFIHKDFVDEVDALSQLSGMPFDKLFFLNFMFKACSSVLVKNSEGKVVHGRNMDFELW